MTELYIDGISVVLSKDFAVKVKQENPFITKNGEYTYDLVLPLTNPTNADLYRHINRTNIADPAIHDRTAILIADNRVYCQGREVITGIDNESVSIQIVAGNSELNYLKNKDMLIEDIIGMPVTQPYTFEQLYKDGKIKAEGDLFCQPPVVNAAGAIVNAYQFSPHKGSDDRRGWMSLVLEQKEESEMYTMPYLVPYIEEVIKGLGYKVVENALKNDELKKLYIAQTAHPSDWAKMLPGWKVTDFITEVEKLFNVVVVIDARKKEARIVFRNRYYIGGHTAHVVDVIDEWQDETFAEEQKEDVTRSSIKYNVDDNEYWRRQSLPDYVLERAKVHVFKKELFSPKELELTNPVMRIQDYLNWEPANLEGLKSVGTIYVDEYSNKKFYFVNEDLNEIEELGPFTTHINRGEHRQTIELKIVPASMIMTECLNLANKFYVKGGKIGFKVSSSIGDFGMYKFGHHIPYAIEVATINAQNEGGNEYEVPDVSALLQSGAPAKPSAGNIYIANYTVFRYNNYVDLAHSTIRSTIRYRRYATMTEENEWFRLEDIPNADFNLDLKNISKNLYENKYDINLLTERHFKSFDQNMYDPRFVFEIKNKRYVCASIEYTIDAHGRKGAWEGVFYPIKMSDVEADAKWILEDGRWRDGGVYVDNGRWLDS